MTTWSTAHPRPYSFKVRGMIECFIPLFTMDSAFGVNEDRFYKRLGLLNGRYYAPKSFLPPHAPTHTVKIQKKLIKTMLDVPWSNLLHGPRPRAARVRRGVCKVCPQMLENYLFRRAFCLECCLRAGNCLIAEHADQDSSFHRVGCVRCRHNGSQMHSQPYTPKYSAPPTARFTLRGRQACMAAWRGFRNLGSLILRGSHYLGIYVGGSPIFVNPQVCLKRQAPRKGRVLSGCSGHPWPRNLNLRSLKLKLTEVLQFSSCLQMGSTTPRSPKATKPEAYWH